MQIEVKTAEAAALMGRGVRSVQRWVNSGQLPATQRLNPLNRPEYYIPLSALPVEAQQRYFAQCTVQVQVAYTKLDAPAALRREIDEFSAAERAEIDFWHETIAKWLTYRCRGSVLSKADIDSRFLGMMQLEHPERAISLDILYRKWAAIRERNDEALVDKRGKWKRDASKVDPDVAEIFCGFYLEETKKPNVQEAMRSTEDWFTENDITKLPLPSYSTFRRVAETIPPAVRNRAIMGKKYFDDENGLYIRRNYEKLKANDVWVTDNHTFDVMTLGRNGKPHRLYLTAFIDARSGIFTGWYVTEAPSSQSTIYALRRAILKFGLPVRILSDNGREFLTYDLGGRGKRAKRKLKSGAIPFEPPTILKRLQIDFRCAQVKNAKAKPIERSFLNVKGQFSRLWDTYTGGNVVEKPECLKDVLKRGKIPTDEEFIHAVDLLIEGYFNMQKYNGAVIADKGKRKIDVYHEQMGEQRRAGEGDLRLMMLRTTRPQKVGRRGVHVTVCGAQFDFFTADFLLAYQGRDVFVRYDPDDLSACRVYDISERFITELPRDTTTELDWDATHEEVSSAMREVREFERKVRERLGSYRIKGINRATALSLRLSGAKRAIEAETSRPKSRAPIRIVKAEETQMEPLLAAVGAGDEVDIFALTRSAELRHAEREMEE